MDSTPSTEEVMADTGPIFSTLPTSSSSTLEKIPPRSVCRAFAVQRYWASPVSSSSRSMITAVSKAEATALAPSPAVMAGDAHIAQEPGDDPGKSGKAHQYGQL